MPIELEYPVNSEFDIDFKETLESIHESEQQLHAHMDTPVKEKATGLSYDDPLCGEVQA